MFNFLVTFFQIKSNSANFYKLVPVKQNFWIWLRGPLTEEISKPLDSCPVCPCISQILYERTTEPLTSPHCFNVLPIGMKYFNFVIKLKLVQNVQRILSHIPKREEWIWLILDWPVHCLWLVGCRVFKTDCRTGDLGLHCLWIVYMTWCFLNESYKK